MNKNYSAWQIPYDDFWKLPAGRERLQFLVRFAVLAPSSHNSQPWKFVVDDAAIFIMPEEKRMLPVSDPENRHCYIALGCAAENIRIAARYYHLDATIEYFPESRPGAAVKISFSPRGSHGKDSYRKLTHAITSRRSVRTKYADRMIDPVFLNWLHTVAVPGMQVSVVADRGKKNAITDLVMASRLKAFSNKAFREEMVHYKRTNITSSSTGIPGFTMGIGTLFSLFAPFFIRHFNIMRLLQKSEDALLRSHTPVFVIISSEHNEKKEWLRAGEILERVILEAEARGVQTALSAVPLNIDPLKDMLSISYRPQMIVRMGYANEIPGHAPRIPASEVIE